MDTPLLCLFLINYFHYIILTVQFFKCGFRYNCYVGIFTTVLDIEPVRCTDLLNISNSIKFKMDLILMNE
ncbi:hypothetical protein RIF29_28378 [Crotalaria pallida]|uniref:Uncharacterized protein n=1 Tax=Crotalaria pallida TaxID=3830 RepID=A0AAN9EVK9_CROPI